MAAVSATLGSVAARQTAATQVLISIGGHSQRSLRDSRTVRGKMFSLTVLALKGRSKVMGDCRQEAEGSSCNNLGEQTTKLSSMMMALAATTLVAATCVNVAEANSLESLQIEAGAVFERSCAGCHTGGGNILQPFYRAFFNLTKFVMNEGYNSPPAFLNSNEIAASATLRKEDLEKNGLAAVDDIYNITYFGKNRMPGYGEKCTPSGQCTFGPRLSEENIRALADFVKLQADQGWSK